MPRSTSTTSPEPSIEPSHLRRQERRSELGADLVLSQATHCDRHRLANRRTQFARQPLDLLVGLLVDPNARALHRYQHTFCMHLHIACTVRTELRDIAKPSTGDDRPTRI